MRIPPVVLSLLFLSATTLAAQGLEYRVRMHMSMPGMPDGMPTPETTMLMENGKIRVDNHTRGVNMSVIMDGTSMFFVNHADKTYREETSLEKVAGKEAARDTAALRKMGLLPEVIKVDGKRTILGYAADHYVMVMRIPVPGEAGVVMYSINDSWISTDPALRDAFNESIEAAERVLGPAAGEMKSLMPPGAQGVPLESNILMVKRAASEKVDALALLKESAPAGLMTRARMETLNIKVRNLPDSLFAVPAGYKKAN